MTVSFSPGDDFARAIDGLQSVTFLRPGTSLRVEVVHALVHPAHLVHVERSDGQYPTRDAVWHLPLDELPISPRPGDLVLESDRRQWTVLAVQRVTLGQRWRCVCRNLVELYRLDQYIDLQRATYRKGEQGEELPSWQTWRTGVRARIQPQETQTTSQHDRPVTRSRYKIFCLEDLQLTHHDRIRGPDGTVYQVLGTTRARRIDAALEIDAEKQP